MTDEGAAVSRDDRAVPAIPDGHCHSSDPVERARALHEVYDAVLVRRRRPDRAALAGLGVVAAQPGRATSTRTARPAGRRTATAELRRGPRPRTRSDAVLPLLRSTLVSIADEAVHVMLVTDADGTILWREGARKPAARGRRGGAGAGHPLVARRRSARTRWAPRWPSTRRCRSTPPSTWCAPSTRGPARPRPCTTRTPARSSAPSTSAARCTRAHPAMVQLVVGHRAAGGEPAAGAPGHRGRAAADAQHAAPRQPARPAGRAGHAERADPRRRAVRGLAGARADRSRASTGSGSTTGARWPSSRWPRGTCCTRTRPHRRPGAAPGAVAAVPRRPPLGAARRHARPA